MKIKNLIIILFLSLLFLKEGFSDEINFEASEMDIKDNGNIIFAYNSKTIIPNKKITIVSKKVKYIKDKNVVIFSDNVVFDDKVNNIIIKGSKITYERDKDLIYSDGTTRFYIEGKYKIKSKNVFFDRYDQIIFGNNEQLFGIMQ